MAALGWRRAVGELPLALDGARLGGRRDAVRFARGTSRRLRLAFGLAFRSAHYLGSVPSLHSILATRISSAVGRVARPFSWPAAARSWPAGCGARLGWGGGPPARKAGPGSGGGV